MTPQQRASRGGRWSRLVPIAVVLIAGQLLWQPAAAATVPGMPTMQSATAGDQQATVSWIAPTDGGSPITGYTIRAYVGLTVSKTFPNVQAQCPLSQCSATVSGLANGTSYTLTVAAVNSVGEGAESVQSNSVTPSGVPGAPTTVQAVGGNGTATVSWTAPGSNGSPITSYTVRAYSGTTLVTTITGVACATSTCSYQVTGLTNGQTYTFTVQAVNANGPGAESAKSNQVVVGTPDAPTNVQATAGTSQATVTWTAPNNNGSPITGYTVTAYLGSTTTVAKTQSGGSATTMTVTGLANGQQYSFTVKATNLAGTGPESSRSNVVLVGAPAAPAQPTATAGDQQATVTWTPPSQNGGVITSYTVRAYDGTTLAKTVSGVLPGTACSNNSCHTAVTGLTNGTAYTFTVAAANAYGEGPESSPSGAITPAGAPGAPTIGAATAGNGKANVSWTAPASNGGQIASYTIRAYSGGVVAKVLTGVTCANSSCNSDVTPLTNCTSYTFTVAAVNTSGIEGSQSAASNSVTPTTTKPCAPAAPTATAGNTQAAVTWTPPSTPANSPITSYTVRAYKSGQNTAVQTLVNIACSTATCTTTVSGLTNGTTYTFTVAAVNKNGEGNESGPSNAVTPAAVPPNAPVIGNATAGNASAVVTWSAPADNGTPITSYTVRAFTGTSTTPVQTVPNVTCTTANCSTTVTGLTNGTTYTFTVSAVNSTLGESAQSAASNAVTPAGVPDAPTNLQATAGDASATVTWAAPTNNGSSAITGYTVTLTAGSTSLTQQVSPSGTLQATFTNLSNGTTYNVAVVAVNAAGPGAAANTSVTPRGALPGAPTNISVTVAAQSATVTWSPPSGTATSITGYTVTAYNGSTSTVAATVNAGPTATSATVTGLTTGVTYTFTVTASSAAGRGPESARSSSVTLPGLPGTPTNVQATAGIGQATVSWTPPGSNGGSTITSYVVTAQSTTAGNTSVTVNGSSTSATVPSLTPGATYVFTVAAVNALGQGTASSASSSITIPSLPGIPRNLRVTAQNGSAQVSWDAPASDGGKPITGYQISVSDGVHPATVLNSTSTSVTVNGLSNGVTYTVTVVALNAVGQSGSISTGVTLGSSPSGSNASPSLDLPSDQTVRYGHTLSFDVSAADADAGDQLTLSAAGLPNGLSFTDNGGGHGTVSGTMQAPAGTYAAVFTVNDGHTPTVSHSLTITVVRDAASVTPAGANPSGIALKKAATTASTITLKATVAPSSAGAGGNIANAAPISCALRSMNSGAAYTGKVATKDNGRGGLAATCKLRMIPVDVYRVQFKIGGQYYSGSATDFLTVYTASQASVQAKGTIVRRGVIASFSISAAFGKGNQLRGTLVYTEHRSTGDVTVASTIVGGLVFKAHKAYLEARATLNGGGSYTVVATLLSNGYRHAKDRFGIRLVSNHKSVSDLSFSPAELSSGTVVVKHT